MRLVALALQRREYSRALAPMLFLLRGVSTRSNKSRRTAQRRTPLAAAATAATMRRSHLTCASARSWMRFLTRYQNGRAMSTFSVRGY